MNAARSADQDSRNRKFLVALALLFFLPLAASFYMYYGPVGWRPAKHVNRGDLIDPARPLPDVSLPAVTRDAERPTKPDFLKGKWTLLYYGTGRCSALCRTDLYNTRQIRIALNRDMDRVQRVFLADGECCDWPFLESEHPDLLTVRATPEAAPLLALLPAVAGVAPLKSDRVYLIDPLGNLMMSYAPNARPKGMLEDLKRLLGLSHVG
jgi:cytochrome oxidase Cu insertion factor (SCO1/SenC/PrrC family)